MRGCCFRRRLGCLGDRCVDCDFLDLRGMGIDMEMGLLLVAQG